jgi:hypothetical protein
MLDKYASIYNKNGRIGIYTREVSHTNSFRKKKLSSSINTQERDIIISRFRAKRKRRVWRKKIRYHCRKNLADSRVRVKGRFVKSRSGGKSNNHSNNGLESLDDESNSNEEQAARDTISALLLASQSHLQGSDLDASGGRVRVRDHGFHTSIILITLLFLFVVLL